MAGRGTGPDFVEALARGLDVLACSATAPDDPRRGRRGRRPGPAHRAPAAAHARGARLRPVARRRLRADPAGPAARDGVRRRAGPLGRRPPAPRGPRGRTGESSSMAQLDGSDIVYVARVSRAEDHRPARRDRHPLPGGPDLPGQGPAGRPAARGGGAAPLAVPSQAGLPPYIGRTAISCARSCAGARPRLGARRRGARARRPFRRGPRSRRGGRRARRHERHRARRRDQRRHAARRTPAAPAARGRRGQRRLGAVAVPPARRGRLRQRPRLGRRQLGSPAAAARPAALFSSRSDT